MHAKARGRGEAETPEAVRLYAVPQGDGDDGLRVGTLPEARPRRPGDRRESPQAGWEAEGSAEVILEEGIRQRKNLDPMALARASYRHAAAALEARPAYGPRCASCLRPKEGDGWQAAIDVLRRLGGMGE